MQQKLCSNSAFCSFKFKINISSTTGNFYDGHKIQGTLSLNILRYLASVKNVGFKNYIKNVIFAGVIPGRWGTGHASIVPYQTFQTQDGYLTIACGSNAHFRYKLKSNND
jgi:hypothetical protein